MNVWKYYDQNPNPPPLPPTAGPQLLRESFKDKYSNYADVRLASEKTNELKSVRSKLLFEMWPRLRCGEKSVSQASVRAGVGCLRAQQLKTRPNYQAFHFWPE